VLILGRTSWHYDEGRRAAAARPPQARRCARVSDKVAGRAVPDLSNARPLRRVPVALRSHALRAASRRHYPRVRVALVGDTHSSRAVRPTGACRAPATNAAGGGWVQSAASTKRGRQAPLTSPFRHATRPSQARLAGAPGETRKRCHTTLVPILHQVKVKRSYQPGGQGRRAGGRGQGRGPSGYASPGPLRGGKGKEWGPRGAPLPAPSEGGRELFSVHLQRGWWYTASRQLRLAPCLPGILTNTQRGIQYVIN